MAQDNRIISVCNEVLQYRYRQLAAQQERNWPEALRLIEEEKQHASTCPECRGLGFIDGPEYKEWLKTAGKVTQ